MSYKLSPKIAIVLCLGAILGDTLFVFTGVPIAESGPYSLFAYVAVGILVALIATQLSELGSIMPHEKGGAYSYVSRSFGSELGFITGLLLYLGYCAMIAAVAFGFGGYLISILGIGGPTAQIAIAATIILIISAINMRGIKNTAELTKILLAIALLTAIAFVVFALLNAHGWISIHTVLNIHSNFDLGPFSQAATAIVFAYAGFQIITTLTDNIKGGGRKVAYTMIISILIGMIAYITVTIALIILMPNNATTITAQPLVEALRFANAPPALLILIGVGALFSISASMIALVFIASRLIYQIGNDGLLPKETRLYDKRRSVARNGILITTAISILLLFSGGLYTILSISNFGIIFSWMMACFALINLHRRKMLGEYIAPYYPYITIISIAACAVFLFGLPVSSLALGTIVILVLLVVYHTIVEIKYRDVHRVRLFD